MLVVEAIAGRRIDALRGPELRRGDAPLRRRAGGAPQPAGPRRRCRASPASTPSRHGAGRRGHRPRAARRRRRRRAARASALGGARARPPARPSACTATCTSRTRSSRDRRIALIDLDQAGARPAGGRPRQRRSPALRYRALVADEAARGERVQRALLDGYAAVARPAGRATSSLARRRRPARRARAARREPRPPGRARPPRRRARRRARRAAQGGARDEPPDRPLLLPALARARPPRALVRARRAP